MIKTNADAIRAMTDEELAVWIAKITNSGMEQFDYMMCKQCKTEHGGICPVPEEEPCPKSDNFVLEWLRQANK